MSLYMFRRLKKIKKQSETKPKKKATKKAKK